MPSFGGRMEVTNNLRSRTNRRSAHMLIVAGAVGLVFCAVGFVMFVGHSDPVSEIEKSADLSDSDLQKMQLEVKEQLAQAASRKAEAKKHREQAKKLAADAAVDRAAAKVMRLKSELIQDETTSKADSIAVTKAKDRVQALKAKSASLKSVAEIEVAKADKKKEAAAELEDNESELDKKAAQQDKSINKIQRAANREASALPELLKTALSTEARAAKLKRAAEARMEDSTAKMEKAHELDKKAIAKDQQASVLREEIVSELEKKADSLEHVQAQAKHADHTHAVSDVVVAAHPAPASEEVSSLHHKVLENRRRTNLIKSALATQRMRSARGRDAAPVVEKARTQGLAEVSSPLVHENEEGHMVVAAGKLPGPTTAHMAEDGHYSEREEAFKRAMAAATGDHSDADELLQKGAGDAVGLEKEHVPLFTQLWYDPDSLPSVTKELRGTTRRLARDAPADEHEAASRPQMLYEDGHQSREESVRGESLD
mmetsp:Transcript_55771/g.147365  ORF Transcript_55771/g.147365 Transcript_55771/m.147365 type:complete len:486 (+) Transcript_55771:136-1593(+)